MMNTELTTAQKRAVKRMGLMREAQSLGVKVEQDSGICAIQDAIKAYKRELREAAKLDRDCEKERIKKEKAAAKKKKVQPISLNGDGESKSPTPTKQEE